MANSDLNLLRDFVQRHDEDAFHALTRRYLGLIFHVAYRQTNNRSLSQDISQSVLLALSKKAPLLLKKSQDLAPWLHRTTLYESTKAMRSEQSQQRRKDGLAQKIDTEDSSQAAAWKEALPHLDEALNKLPESDRRVLILHFFEEKTFPNIAQTVGKSPAAAQKQSRRALEKLAQILKRKGVVISSVALASCLSSELAKAAPPNLLKTLCTITLTTSSPLLASLLGTKGPQILALVAGGSLVTLLGARQVEISEKKHQNQELRNQLAQPPLKSNRPLRKSNSLDSGSFQPDAKLLAEAYYQAQITNMGSTKTALLDYLASLDEDALADILAKSTSALLPRKQQREGSYVYVLIKFLARKNPERAVQIVFESYKRDRSQDFRDRLFGAFQLWYNNPKTSAAARLWLQEQESRIVGTAADDIIFNRFRSTVLTDLIKKNDPATEDYLHTFNASNQCQILTEACQKYSRNYRKKDAEVMMQLCQHLDVTNRRRVLRELIGRNALKHPLQWLEDLQECSPLLEHDRDFLLLESAKKYVFVYSDKGERIAELHQWLHEKDPTRSNERLAEALIQRSETGLRAATAFSQKSSQDGWIISYLSQEKIPDFFQKERNHQQLRSLAEKILDPLKRDQIINHLALEN
ncbi:MAG: RNA polymerase sigma factor [Roseibacillus sp.]